MPTSEIRFPRRAVAGDAQALDADDEENRGDEVEDLRQPVRH